jgi:two-component system chemotaxis sensor kinase CheA
MAQFDQFKQTFFEESDELLLDASGRASDLDPSGYDIEELHALFRAVHTIKAGAGAFKFTALAEFTHRFETLLDQLRDGKQALDQNAVDLIVRGLDIVSEFMDAAKSGEEPDRTNADAALAEINAILDPAGAAAPAASAAPVAAAAAAETASSGRRTYAIHFKPGRQLFQFANEPLLFIRELKTFGDLEVKVDASELPALDRLEAEDSYLSWRMTLATERTRDEIAEVFEFVVDDALIEIEEIGAEASEKPAEAAVAVSAAAAVPAAEDSAKPEADKATAAGNMSQDKGTVREPGKKAGVTSIRVDLDRIDRLVNMVGELVITQAMITQQARTGSANGSNQQTIAEEELASHTRELQDAVMAIRMQPVKSVFMRMPRLVRDLSRKLGKNVNLVMRGEQTEVDKTIIEELADPLTHMIRNSLDHGIELPEDRLKAGKPEAAEIVLSAEHRHGKIVIQVTDDGRGINRERVRQKAVQQGLIATDSNMSDEEIDNLIFAPGFSTAEQVTDVSGRGVGMDVVRRNIQNLGGRVIVQSRPGLGTKFSLTLPLTLAVLDGMVVSIGDEEYIIPLTSIIETVRPAAKDIRRIDSNFDTFAMRGDYLRLIYLSRMFNIPGAISDASKALVVVVDTETAGRVGIVVDELLGQQQVVIKSIDSNYQNVEGISGATILGSGRVSLILDLDGLAEMRTFSSPADNERAEDEGNGFGDDLDAEDDIGPAQFAAPAAEPIEMGAEA